MENSYFIYSNEESCVEIERFHNCIWEFDNNSSLIEFGFEISKESLVLKNHIELCLFIPWLTDKSIVEDLYEKLKDAENSRFIFNDSVINTNYLDGGLKRLGVIHKFKGRGELCILPINFRIEEEKLILKIDLKNYNKHQKEKHNIYIRFSIKPIMPYISTRKKGIAKSTVIYDIKINEKRNIPYKLLDELNNKELCKIEQCFCFNILPNRYDIVFFDNESLKNVRMLEYESFKRYIGDKRVKKDDLMVVFNKKKGGESFSFFSIYAKERIGISQFSMAILLNIFCGLLFFIASVRTTPKPNAGFFNVIIDLPIEIYAALAIIFLTLVYFLFPYLNNSFSWMKSKIISLLKYLIKPFKL